MGRPLEVGRRRIGRERKGLTEFWGVLNLKRGTLGFGELSKLSFLAASIKFCFGVLGEMVPLSTVACTEACALWSWIAGVLGLGFFTASFPTVIRKIKFWTVLFF